MHLRVLGSCGCAISSVIRAISKITHEFLVSRVQRDILLLKVQFCYRNSTELIVKFCQAFLCNMCIFDFFPYCSVFILSCITDMGLSFLPSESFEVTVTKEGDKGFFLSLL